MTKTDLAIQLAHKKGYRVTDDGKVINAVGRVRKVQTKNAATDPRYVFNVGIGKGKRFPVMVHRLQAYQKYGAACFADGIVVRHLDGNALNNTPKNIALGTVRDNCLDRPKKDRQLHAQKGNRGAGAVDERTWKKITSDHARGVGYKKLRQKYGVSLSSLSYRLSKTSKYRLLDNR